MPKVINTSKEYFVAIEYKEGEEAERIEYVSNGRGVAEFFITYITGEYLSLNRAKYLCNLFNSFLKGEVSYDEDKNLITLGDEIKLDKDNILHAVIVEVCTTTIKEYCILEEKG